MVNGKLIFVDLQNDITRVKEFEGSYQCSYAPFFMSDLFNTIFCHAYTYGSPRSARFIVDTDTMNLAFSDTYKLGEGFECKYESLNPYNNFYMNYFHKGKELLPNAENYRYYYYISNHLAFSFSTLGKSKKKGLQFLMV